MSLPPPRAFLCRCRFVFSCSERIVLFVFRCVFPCSPNVSLKEELRVVDQSSFPTPVSLVDASRIQNIRRSHPSTQPENSTLVHPIFISHTSHISKDTFGAAIGPINDILIHLPRHHTAHTSRANDAHYGHRPRVLPRSTLATGTTFGRHRQNEDSGPHHNAIPYTVSLRASAWWEPNNQSSYRQADGTT